MKRKDPYDRHEVRASMPRRRAYRSSRNRRRRRRIPRLVWLITILLVEIALVALNDPRFNLSRIEVRGNKVLTTEQVTRRAGLILGVNLYRARLKPARQRLLEVPAVADVSLHRRIPNRIVIRVHERQPFACVAIKNVLFTIDSEGVAFRMDHAPPPGLPLVTGLGNTRLRLGGSLTPAPIKALRECMAASKAPPGYTLTRISIDQNANLCFNSAGTDYQVRLGPPERLSEKFTLLTALERSLPDLHRGCEYIDLSCLEAPAWKPKSVSVAGHVSPGKVSHSGILEAPPHDRGRLTQD